MQRTTKTKRDCCARYVRHRPRTTRCSIRRRRPTASLNTAERFAQETLVCNILHEFSNMGFQDKDKFTGALLLAYHEIAACQCAAKEPTFRPTLDQALKNSSAALNRQRLARLQDHAKYRFCYSAQLSGWKETIPDPITIGLSLHTFSLSPRFDSDDSDCCTF